MIEKIIRLESILITPYKNIAVLLNTECLYKNYTGYNDYISNRNNGGTVRSFASFLVKHNIVPQFGELGQRQLGEVIRVETIDTTFFGMICYEMNDLQRDKSPEAITECLDKICLDNQTIACALMGEEIISTVRKNFNQVIQAVHKSKTRTAIYNPMIEGNPMYGYSLPDNLKIYLSTKDKRKSVIEKF